jgi:hypothetical protein
MARYDSRHDSRSELPAHTPGTPRGEERVHRYGRGLGREHPTIGPTARDSTSINADDCGPIDPRMPHMPPA